MKINLKLLQKTTNDLFQHLDDLNINEVEIKEDFYWNIPREHKYNPYKEPENLDVGQLQNDWDEILKISSKESEPITYALVWLSSLLRIIGEQIVK